MCQDHRQQHRPPHQQETKTLFGCGGISNLQVGRNDMWTRADRDACETRHEQYLRRNEGVDVRTSFVTREERGCDFGCGMVGRRAFCGPQQTLFSPCMSPTTI